MAKKQIQTLPKTEKKVNRVKRTDIGFINEHGLEITFEEQEEFRQLVNRAKRKAKTITSKYDGSYHNYAKPYLNHLMVNKRDENDVIKIIAYRSSMDIDIQDIKTGVIKTNLRYDHVTRKYILKGVD